MTEANFHEHADRRQRQRSDRPSPLRPRPHEGDTWVVFPALRVMHAGDMFARKGVPLIDGSNGGSGVEFPETLSKAADYAKNVETIITGHSVQMTGLTCRSMRRSTGIFWTPFARR